MAGQLAGEMQALGVSAGALLGKTLSEETAPLAAHAGAHVLVAGSAIFGKADRAAAIQAIRNHTMNL